MKRYIQYTVNVCLILALLLCTSCEKETLVTTLSDKNTVTLNLRVGDLKSRTIEDDENLNENLINTLNIFLYPTGSTTPIHEYFDGLTDKITSNVTLAAKASELFPDGTTECGVYVIANYPGGKISETDLSIDNLKKLTVSSTTFTDAEAETNFVMDSDGNDKITNNSGQITGTINLYRAAAKIEVYVAVDRVEYEEEKIAWKPVQTTLDIDFHNGVNKTYVGNDVEANKYYTPAEGETVLFDNDKIVFNTDNTVEFTYSGAGTLSGVKFDCYTTTLPYYTYPMKWSSQETDSYPYFIMTMTWQKQTIKTADNGEKIYNDVEGETKTISYAIPVNKDGKNIDRNNCYQLLVNLGVAGVDVHDIEASYILVQQAQWGSAEISATMAQNVYLVVDENEVTMSNVESTTIGYTSSHAIDVNITSITQVDLSSVKPGTTTYYSGTGIKKSVTAGTNGLLNACTVSLGDNNTIVLNHVLKNRDECTSWGDTEFDLTPYTITLLVTMDYDNDGTADFTEEITIVQYPSIYMVAELNSAHSSWTSTDTQKGYVILNGDNEAGETGTFGSSTVTTTKELTGASSTENVQWLGRVFGDITPETGEDDSGTKNPNMYVLTISSFSDNTYLIGDPRTANYTNVFQEYSTGDLTTGDSDNDGYWDNTANMQFSSDNGNVNVWANSYALYQGSRRLTYYYPADESKDMQKVIAPKLRFCSSHGVPAPVVKTLEMAKRRCAAYQEDGYPAGRWRLPTKAEVEFTLGLSNAGKIPHVFNTNLPYWSAHGYFSSNMTFNEETSVSGQGSVRCVYDEWYWNDGQLTDKTKFTWGDYPRDQYSPTTN